MGERGSGIHWTGGWVVPRIGLGDEEKRKFLSLPGLKTPLYCPIETSKVRYSCRYPEIIKHYAVKAYRGVDV
jgi:hypothetical protein